MTTLYEKKTNARIEILETRETGYLVRNPEFPEDQYVIPFDVFEQTYRPVDSVTDERETLVERMVAHLPSHIVASEGSTIRAIVEAVADAIASSKEMGSSKQEVMLG